LALTGSAAFYDGNPASWTPANVTVVGGAEMVLNVGGTGDFSATQAGTLLGNLSTGLNNNGLEAGSTFAFDTSHSTANVNISANIADTAGAGGGSLNILKQGNGTLQFSGSNTYTGKTTITTGSLVVSSLNSVNGGSPLLAASSLGAPTTVANGTINLGVANSNGNNGTLVYVGPGETTDRVINFPGQENSGCAISQSGSGVLTFTSSFTMAANANKTVTLQGSTSGVGQILGSIGNPGLAGKTTSVTKNGTGEWILGGVNTYSGVTTVSAGTLQFAKEVSLYNNSPGSWTASNIQVAGGAMLALNVGGSGEFTSSDVGTLATNLAGANSSLANTSLLGLDTTNAAGGSFTLAANLLNSNNGTGAVGLTKLGGNTLVLSGNSTFTGPIAVTAGTISISGVGSLGSAGNFPAGIAINGSTALNFNSSAAQTFSGVISGSGSLTQSSGQLAITGNNPFTGPVAISGGTLTAGSAMSLGFGSVGLSGGALGISGATLPNNLALSGGSIYAPSNAGLSGNLSGPGSLVKTGGGLLSLSGSSSYSGATVVSGGTLRLASAPTLPSGITIMPLGDSITYGVVPINGVDSYANPTAGYRGTLYNYLATTGNTIQYVGSSNGSPGSLPTSPLDETWQEGHPGYTSAQILSGLPGWLTAGSQPYHQLPKVIMLMIGTNDADTGVSTSSYASNVANIISTANLYDPGVQFLLADVIPLPSNSSNYGTIASYNATLPGIAAAANAAGDNVSLVDLNTNYPVGDGLPITGDVHPTATGYAWMASQWYNALISTASAASSASPSASLPTNSPTTVAAGATLDLNGVPTTLGPLNGAGNILLGNAGALTLNNNNDSTFSGSISGSGSLTETGTATLVLSGSNSFSGGTNVLDGTLVLNGADSLLAGSSLTIGSAAGPDVVFTPPQIATHASSTSLAPVPEPGTLALLAVMAIWSTVACCRFSKRPASRKT
jgi:autotransporter-associated beta strand protein